MDAARTNMTRWLLVVAAVVNASVTFRAVNGPAFVVYDLDGMRKQRESRPDVLDTPVLPGSVMKAVTLVAALESGVLDAGVTRMCRRVVTIDGIRYTCTHPDLKRPLSAAEALAHSCNDFFLALAPRLSRQALNATRRAAGLGPVDATTPLAPALIGLDGPRTSARALVSVLARLSGAGGTPVPMRAETRRVLLEGLRGAAEFGTASAFHDRGISALAKTGTSPMPGGGVMGLLIALTPAGKPVRGLAVVAPGAAGLDAASIAAGLLAPADAERRQKDTVRLRRTLPDGSTRVETVALDDYVSQVVAGEGQPDAGSAAQQALAITARTFTLANRGRHEKEGFDFCDTTHCQAVRPATKAARTAASSTAGRVLLHDGHPASVFHSAWCGGRPERASEVWKGETDYGSPAREDDACAAEPGWRSEVRAADLERALRSAGLRGTTLRELRVVERNPSGRVARVRVDGFSPAEIGGDDLRTAIGRTVGWQLVKSTLFDIERTASGYRFSGRGFGHGVGLCVLGAGRRAAKGATAEAILGFYFPGLRIGPVDTRTTDVALALPGDEESHRQALLSLIRRSRDQVSRAAGVSAPAQLRVTVHPTVESFRRATGQPWHVSAATRGADIDLLPIAILEQQRQLERSVRHEVAHAVLDPSLEGRPMWVREGAASYFAASAAGVEQKRNATVVCPADRELREPVSAEAQRDAYARAEACFAGAMTKVRSWREIR